MGHLVSKPLSLLVEGFDPAWSERRIIKFMSEECDFPYISLRKETDNCLVFQFDNEKDLETATESLCCLRIGNSGVRYVRINSTVENAKKALFVKKKKNKKKKCTDLQLLSPNIEIDYAEQVRLKSLKATNEFMQIFHVIYPTITVVESKKRFSFCNQCSLSFGYDNNNNVLLGFPVSNSGTKRIIPFADCVSFYPQVYEIVEQFLLFISKAKAFPFDELNGTGIWKSLFIQTNDTDSILTIEVAQALSESLQKELITSIQTAKSIFIKQNNTLSVLSGPGIMHNVIDNVDFQILPGIDYPSNFYAFESYIGALLYLKLFSKDKTLVHLNCGCCWTSMCLSKDVANVVSIDSSPTFINYATKTAIESHLDNMEFLTGNSHEIIDDVLPKYQKDRLIVLIQINSSTQTPKLIQKVIENEPMCVIAVSEGTSLTNNLTPFSSCYNLYSGFLVDFYPHSENNCYVTVMIKKKT